MAYLLVLMIMLICDSTGQPLYNNLEYEESVDNTLTCYAEFYSKSIFSLYQSSSFCSLSQKSNLLMSSGFLCTFAVQNDVIQLMLFNFFNENLRTHMYMLFKSYFPFRLWYIIIIEVAKYSFRFSKIDIHKIYDFL